ncbi:NAD(P)/FAD-dependent oxidoreductase [Fulvimarina sp. MAC8]|uniref:FAD-dependent oxidoreductase n=1 Tax=Fulvimarina sp. MAC8 TaxID=3162874 RepID=UPI0032EC0BA3
MTPLKIAVVGAGPAGLAAAILLARLDHSVTIFEQFPEPRPVGSGLLLQPTGMAVLAEIGALEATLARGQRIDNLEGRRASDKRLVLDVAYRDAGPGRFGHAVHRHVLFDVLYQIVRGEDFDLRTGFPCEALEATGDGNRLVSASGAKTESFDLVIDASGARSKLRSLAFPDVEPKQLPFGAIWTTVDFRSETEPHRLVQRYRKADVMVGVLPLGQPFAGEGNKAALFWSVKPDEYPDLVAKRYDAFANRIGSFFPEAEPLFRRAEGFEAMTLARYTHHTLPNPVKGRLVFIGDAAHSASPQLGQGANMALLDAAALAAAFATERTAEDALPAYVKSRRLHLRLFQALSAAFTPFYQSDSSVFPLIRDRLVPPLASLGVSRKLLAHMVSGTLLDPMKRIGLSEGSAQVLRPIGGSP